MPSFMIANRHPPAQYGRAQPRIGPGQLLRSRTQQPFDDHVNRAIRRFGHLSDRGDRSERLGVGVLTIRSWVRTDHCPVVRDGRLVRIPAQWVDGLLARGWQA